jgi:hypothetical protein
MVGPIELKSAAIRVLDFGSVSKIPDADADPDEIVAIGRKKKEPDYRSLHVAADALTGCSSITFDKPRKRIILSCMACPKLRVRSLALRNDPSISLGTLVVWERWRLSRHDLPWLFSPTLAKFPASVAASAS